MRPKKKTYAQENHDNNEDVSQKGFLIGRIFRCQIFALMLAKSLFFFVMVAAKWSQIFVLSKKNWSLDFIFLVAKKVKLGDI